MNYVDANILIYSFVDKEEKGRRSVELMDREKLVTSTLTLDEVAFKLMKRSREAAVNAVRIISNSPAIVLVPFLAEDVNAFKELLIKGLKPRDAIHALTAVKMKCPVIYSEDPDFDKIPELKRKTPW